MYPFSTYNQKETTDKVTQTPKTNSNNFQSSNMNVQQPLSMRVGGATYPEVSYPDTIPESELKKRFEILEQAKDRTEFADRLMAWHEEEHNMKMRVMQAQMETETKRQKVIQMEHDNEELRRASMLIQFSSGNDTDGKKSKGKGKNKNEWQEGVLPSASVEAPKSEAQVDKHLDGYDMNSASHQETKVLQMAPFSTATRPVTSLIIIMVALIIAFVVLTAGCDFFISQPI